MTRTYAIKQQVTARDRGRVVEGQIVGVEDVGQRDLRNRTPGQWLIVRTGPMRAVEIHESAVLDVLDAVA